MFSAIRKRNAEKRDRDIAARQERRATLARREFETFRRVVGQGPGVRGNGEMWWCNHYEWLKSCGYLLRPRYATDWVPSWQGTKKSPRRCEDAVVPSYNHLIDATRISDGKFVILKIVKQSRHPFEADIGRFFMSKPLASDLNNHCVPIYDVLSVPQDEDRIILVMPLLRPYSNPPFDALSEVIDCIRQLFTGLQFMHTHRVAHRDCMNLNILMDATSLYKEPFHPFRLEWRRDLSGYAKHYTRTRCRPKYYFIDFGISRRYDLSDTSPLELPILGGDKTVPEFQDSIEPRNPFPTDIYYIGNFLREDFIQVYLLSTICGDADIEIEGFGFLEGLVADMVQDDPSKRPTIDEVVSRFDAICKGLSGRKLHSRVAPKGENRVTALFRDAGHWTRRFVSKLASLGGSSCVENEMISPGQESMKKKMTRSWSS
ncbi:hypothetical protein BJ138DRAFT_1015103 [Hygrophoropsis aurantiaca]|uniref:Uncharacterized protein n=1 Tax=Hygrophoropsis aurantiaca TaxID=72124 RepID=A0ACB8A360_9AGAM|nr:hypothetical protein BJ138DRAFT_1015103 [Hygrophoropsis aurantiaca]